MTTIARIPQPPRELARRENDGLEVTLFWEPETDVLTVHVCDQKRGAHFVIEPAAAQGLDAFYHPYSYASRSVVCYEDERLAA